MGFPRVDKTAHFVSDEEDTFEPGEEVTIDYDKYKGYIERIARKFYKKLPPNSRWDLDDFISEGWLALYEVAERYYDPRYNDNLKAFAYQHIVKRMSEFMANNMYSLKGRYYNVKQNPDNFARMNWLERTIWSESQHGTGSSNEDEDNPLLAKPSGITSMMDEAAHREEEDIIKSIVNEDLPTMERRAIVRRYRNGETYREIGERLRCSPEWARKLILKGLERIKEKAEHAGIASN